MEAPRAATHVTGATGDIGTTLTGLLRDAGHPFRVTCRRPEQVERFREQGVEATYGDFADPSSVRAALEGCDQLPGAVGREPRRRGRLPPA